MIILAVSNDSYNNASYEIKAILNDIFNGIFNYSVKGIYFRIENNNFISQIKAKDLFKLQNWLYSLDSSDFAYVEETPEELHENGSPYKFGIYVKTYVETPFNKFEIK